MMDMRVTSLDAWNYYNNSDMTTEEFIAQLRYETPMSRPAAVGIAFHSAMEDYIKAANKIGFANLEIPAHFSKGLQSWANRGNVVSGKLNFHVSEDIDFELNIAGAKPEVKGEMYLPEVDVRLKGRADLVRGNKIWDFKTSAGEFNDYKIIQYQNSMQWRSYLLMLGAREFTYLYFRIKDKQDADNNVDILSHDVLDLYEYPEMRNDLLSAVNELRDFRIKHGVL